MMTEDFEVVKVEKKHLHDIAELEALCFAHPWTEQGLLTLIGETGVGFAVAEKKTGKTTSYVGMTMAADEGAITNVATHPDFRRLGLARAAMNSLIGYAKENSIRYLSLEVRESNSAAIALYEGLGFSVAGKRPNFYRDPREAALVMTVELL